MFADDRAQILAGLLWLALAARCFPAGLKSKDTGHAGALSR